MGYLIGTVILVFLAGRFKPQRDDTKPVGSVNQRIAEGVRFLWQQRLLRLMALSLTALSACWGTWLALIPLIATDRMGLDTRGYGVLLSALGAGGLLGALTVTTINRVLGRRWSMFADLLGTAAMVAAPVLSTGLWVVATGALLGGMGGILWTVNSRTISQRLVDGGMLGRYNAAARLFSWGAMPVGAGLVGVLAEGFGIRVAFTVFTLATLVIIVPFLRTFTPKALAELDRHPVEDRPAAGTTPSPALPHNSPYGQCARPTLPARRSTAALCRQLGTVARFAPLGECGSEQGREVRQRCRRQKAGVRWPRPCRSPHHLTWRWTTRSFFMTRTSSLCVCCLVTSWPGWHL